MSDYRDLVSPQMRPDLADAHERTWAALSSAGTWWSGAQRHALATAAIDAMWSGDNEPRSATTNVPMVAMHAAARLGSGRPHVTRAWYESVRDQIGALAYVELVGIVATAAAASSLRRTLGWTDNVLPDPDDEPPTRIDPPELADANWNWVPVAAPADKNAAVVQALTAVPATFDELWRLADAQYIPDLEMVDPKWTRGTLTRVDMELLATRVSFSRECHY